MKTVAVYVSNAMDLNVNENDCQSALGRVFDRPDERLTSDAPSTEIPFVLFYAQGRNRYGQVKNAVYDGRSFRNGFVSQGCRLRVAG